MLAGVCSDPGAAVTAGLGLFAGSITGAALALALGASLTGLMIGGLSAWGLFTSTPLEQKLNDVVKKGQSLLTTPTTIDKA